MKTTVKKQSKCIILPNELADKINSLLDVMGDNWWHCADLKALMREKNFPYIPYMPTKLHRENLVSKRSGKYKTHEATSCSIGCANRILTEVRNQSEQCSKRYRELKASKIKTLQANKYLHLLRKR